MSTTSEARPAGQVDGAGQIFTNTIIRPGRGNAWAGLGSLWAHRELLYFMAWRDLKVRYKQAVLGVTWVVLRPFITALLFFFIVNGLRGHAKLDESPIAGQAFGFLHIFCAMLLWELFAGALSRGAVSLVANANLLTKVYFPRLIIPLSTVVVGLVDFAVGAGVLLLLLAASHVVLGWQACLLPLFVLLAACGAFGVGLWLAALNVRYRDISHVVPFFVQIWMLASAVVYPVEAIIHPYTPLVWRALFHANPMVEVIVGFRWALLGGTPPSLPLLAWSAGLLLALLVTGLWFFERTERTFADIV